MFCLLYNLPNIIALIYTAVMLLCFLLRAVIQLLSELTATEKHKSAIPGKHTVSHLYHFVRSRAVVRYSTSK